MAFTIPTFNLTCGIYTAPGIGAPRLTSLCNLSPGKRVVLGSTFGSMELLLPMATDIRGNLSAGGSDWVQCPAGSGRWYLVEYVDDVAKGFANEYRIASMVGTFSPGLGLPWPTPIP